MKTINERMDRAIDEAGWSVKKMAEACDMPPGTFYNILAGSRKPSYATLEKMCQIEPKISAEYLLRGEGEPLRAVPTLPPNTDRKALEQIGQIVEVRLSQTKPENATE